MKQIEDIKVGGIYNFRYFGPNEAYKKQNGQETRKITKIDGDKVEYVTLFSSYPMRLKDNLSSNTVYWYLTSMIACQNEYLIEEVTDASQYIIHSQIMSCQEAVQQGLLTKETIEYVFRNQSKNYIRECPTSSHEGKYFSLQLPAKQDISDNPYLQTIVLLWESTAEMKEDIRSVYPEAWFMY